MSRALRLRIAPAGLVALGFALRTHRLGQADIWWDEGLAVWAVRKSLAEATEWTAGDVHPPLFFWKLWLWIRLAGDGEFAVRLLPALTGTLLLAVIYVLAARIGGRRAGLYALTLATVARFMVWWSMELRMYTAAALCLALAAYAATRWWAAASGASSRFSQPRATTSEDTAARTVASSRRFWRARPISSGAEPRISDGRPITSGPASPGSIGWLTLYTAAALATLMSVYLAGAGLIFIALPPLIALALRRRWRRAAVWLAAQAAALAGFAPWAWYAAERMPSWSIVETPPRLAFVAELWATLLATGVSTAIAEVRLETSIFWIAALGVPVAMATARRIGRREGWPGAADPRVAPEWGVAPFPLVPHKSLVPLITLVAFLLATPLLVWAITQPRSIFYSPRVEARYFLPFAAPVFALLGIFISRAGRSLAPRPSALPLRVPKSLAPSVRHRRPTSAIDVYRRLSPLLLVVALAATLSSLPDYYAPRRRTAALPTMALAIWSQAEPGDVVLLVSGNRYPLFLYHYERMWSRALGMQVYEYPPDNPARRENMPEVVPFPSRGSDILAERTEGGRSPEWGERLDDLMEEHPRIWLVEFGRDLQDPRDEVEAWLDARWPRVLSEGYGPDALHLFAADDQAPHVVRASSRWPWTIPIGNFHSQFGGPGEWLPLAGCPTTVAAAGDAFELTLFARYPEKSPALSPWLIADLGPSEVLEISRGEPDDIPRPSMGASVSSESSVLSDSSDIQESTYWTDTTDSAVVPTSNVAPSLSDAADPASSTPARLRLRVPIDESTPGGRHRLVVRPLYERNVGVKGAGLPVRVIDSAPLFKSARERRNVARIGDYELDSADFTPRQLTPGGTLTLDLMWRNSAEVEDRETRAAAEALAAEDTIERHVDAGIGLAGLTLTPAVFAHLVGPPHPDTGDPVWAVHDGPPSAGHWGRGAASTARIFDRHILKLDPEATPGDYTLEVGLYDPVGGERLPVSGGAGGGTGEGIDVVARRVVLGTVRVVR